jgi:hypothetical protein
MIRSTHDQVDCTNSRDRRSSPSDLVLGRPGLVPELKKGYRRSREMGFHQVRRTEPSGQVKFPKTRLYRQYDYFRFGGKLARNAIRDCTAIGTGYVKIGFVLDLSLVRLARSSIRRTGSA